MLDDATLNKRNHLKWFGAGSQKSDRLRVAKGRKTFSIRVHYGNRTEMGGLNDMSASQFEQELERVRQLSLFYIAAFGLILASIIVFQSVTEALGILFLAHS